MICLFRSFANVASVSLGQKQRKTSNLTKFTNQHNYHNVKWFHKYKLARSKFSSWKMQIWSCEQHAKVGTCLTCTMRLPATTFRDTHVCHNLSRMRPENPLLSKIHRIMVSAFFCKKPSQLIAPSLLEACRLIQKLSPTDIYIPSFLSRPR